VTIPVAFLLFVLLAVFLMGVREAILFYRWMGHLRRFRSTYAQGEGSSLTRALHTNFRN
jgi:hypothetical protein